MSTSPPVFLVGCGRSGTTLLRLMLNAHPEIAIPLESHFIYEVARLRARGQWPESLRDDRDLGKFRSFLEDQYYFSLWKMERDSLWRRLEVSDRSHREVFRAVFLEHAAQQGKARWGDKTPRNVLYLPLLDHFFPDAKFIQVVRDGRDVALSLRRANWGPRYISLAGYYWKWAVLSGKVAGSLLGPSRYREVRYEDLVQDPETILRDTTEWLGLHFSPDQLDYHETKAAGEYARQSEASRRVKRPPDTRRVRRWESEMSPRGQRSLLRQAGALLTLLGYEDPESLSSRQQRERARLQELLRPGEVVEVARDARPRTGSEAKVRWGLRMDRLTQLVAFFSGDFAAWTKAGIRWQRTVARMME